MCEASFDLCLVATGTDGGDAATWAKVTGSCDPADVAPLGGLAKKGGPSDGATRFMRAPRAPFTCSEYVGEVGARMVAVARTESSKASKCSKCAAARSR